MRALFFSLAFAALAGGALAEAVPLDSPRWSLTGQAKRVEHLGRPAVAIKSGGLILQDADLDVGVIEFDIAVKAERGFAGVLFRGQPGENHEHFYIRPHQSGNPDANQYTPVEGGNAFWQVFYGEEYSAPTRYRYDVWMPVRLEVYADSALVTIDGQPPLHIPDLKRERARGYVGFTSTLNDAHVSNVRITRADRPDPNPGKPKVNLTPGLLRQWAVSPALTEADATRRAQASDWAGVAWTALPVETIGVANLSRVARLTEQQNTAIARVTVRSDRAREALFRFGFSERVTMFLNGRRLYRGDDSYRSRDYRFLGTVGLWDAVFLPLKAGDNDLVLVVGDDGGGWAAMGQFDDPAGLTVEAMVPAP